jgi:hypothetical protein
MKPHELNNVSEAFYKPRLEEMRSPQPDPVAAAPSLQRKTSGLSRQSSSMSLSSATEKEDELAIDDDFYSEVVLPNVGSKGKRGGKGKRKSSTGGSSKMQEIWEEDPVDVDDPPVLIARQSSIGTVFE